VSGVAAVRPERSTRGREQLASRVARARVLPVGATALGVTLAVAVTLAAWTPLVELRNAAVLLACVLPLSLADATATLTDATPVPLWRRQLRRLTPALLAVSGTWALLLAVAAPPARVAVGVTLEFAGLALVGLAVAALGQLRSRPAPGIAGAGVVWGLAALGSFLPDGVSLFPMPVEPRWVVVHLAWAILASAGAIGLGLGLRDPAAPQRRR
jgi:hypothetical protein